MCNDCRCPSCSFPTVDGRNPANHPTCMKPWGCLLYQPGSRISEPSTVLVFSPPRRLLKHRCVGLPAIPALIECFSWRMVCRLGAFPSLFWKFREEQDFPGGLTGEVYRTCTDLDEHSWAARMIIFPILNDATRLRLRAPTSRILEDIILRDSM